jgi:hypothetical protein
MAAEFYGILLPPQTLESLDNWGDLDRLPLSLDSSSWENAGIYGLTVSEKAHASETAAFVRVCDAGAVHFAAITRGSMTVGRVVHISGSDSASVGQSCEIVRVRPVSGRGGAYTSGHADGLRQTVINLAPSVAVAGETAYGYTVRGITGTATGRSGENVAFVRYRLDALHGEAHAFGKFDPVRIIHLVESEPAKSGESLTPYRVRLASGSARAKSGEALTAVRIRQDSAQAKAQSAESAALLRIREGSGSAGAVAAALATLERVRLLAGSSLATSSDAAGGQRIAGLVAAGSAQSGGMANGVCVFEIAGRDTVKTGGSLLISAIMQINGTGTATAGGSASLARVLDISGTDHAQSGESIQPTYKGWNWNKEERPLAPGWEPETIPPGTWAQMQKNAAEWAAQSVPAQNWTQQHGGAAQWQ